MGGSYFVKSGSFGYGKFLASDDSKKPKEPAPTADKPKAEQKSAEQLQQYWDVSV